jgi:hypothetical protein
MSTYTSLRTAGCPARLVQLLESCGSRAIVG